MKRFDRAVIIAALTGFTGMTVKIIKDYLSKHEHHSLDYNLDGLINQPAQSSANSATAPMTTSERDASYNRAQMSQADQTLHSILSSEAAPASKRSYAEAELTATMNNPALVARYSSEITHAQRRAKEHGVPSSSVAATTLSDTVSGAQKLASFASSAEQETFAPQDTSYSQPNNANYSTNDANHSDLWIPHFEGEYPKVTAQEIVQEIHNINTNYYQYFRVLRCLMEKRHVDAITVSRALHMKYAKVVNYIHTLIQQGLIENVDKKVRGVDTIGINRIEHNMSSHVDETNLVAKPGFQDYLLGVVKHQITHPRVDYLYRTACPAIKKRVGKMMKVIRSLRPPKVYFIALFYFVYDPMAVPKDAFNDYKAMGIPKITDTDLTKIVQLFKAQYLLNPNASGSIYQPLHLNVQRAKCEVDQIKSFAADGRMPYSDMRDIIAQQLFVQKH